MEDGTPNNTPTQTCAAVHILTKVDRDVATHSPSYTHKRFCQTRKLKIMENEKHPLDDLKNDEITKKTEK